MMDDRVVSDGLRLVAHISRPPGRTTGGHPAVVLSHGYPTVVESAATAAHTMPELADRIAAEMGWIAIAVALRGCSGSEGQFSIGGWLDDITATVDFVEKEERPLGVWLAGFGTSGGLAICAGARDHRIRGVAALGAPADFDDWAGQPRRLLQHARAIGLIGDPAFPPAFDAWSRELRVRAVQCMGSVTPRPVLVLHGTDDESVPPFDARVLADANPGAELRVIAGAHHGLRQDPRAMAILLGWLDRQRTALFA